MAIQLTVLSLDFDSNEPPRTNIYLKEEITMGRDDSNDVVLTSPNVEDFHVRLRVAENGGGIPHLFITDLGTGCGTKVENSPLPAGVESAMDLNQRIVIGDFLIKPSHISDVEDLDEESETEELQADSTMSNGIAHNEYEDESAVMQNEPAADTQNGSIHQEPPMAQDEFTEQRTPVATIKITIEGQDIDNLNFAATRLFDIGGKVMHKGRPLAGVEISAEPIGSVVTDKNGAFQFIAVAEETEYSIKPSFDKFSFEPESIEGKLGDNRRDIKFDAVQLFSISGRVIHKGVALEGVEIDGGPLGITHTDAEGNYIFENVPDGTVYTLTAKKGNFVFGKMQGTMSGKDK